MRIQQHEFNQEPEEYVSFPITAIHENESDKLQIYLRFNIRQLSENEWWADVIYVYIPPNVDIPSYVQEHKNEWISEAQYEDESTKVRQKRDQLLNESDKYMLLDRFDFGSATTFLGFIGKLREALSGNYAKYRKALRDIPQQEGFPFNVVWPEKPNE